MDSGSMRRLCTYKMWSGGGPISNSDQGTKQSRPIQGHLSWLKEHTYQYKYQVAFFLHHLLDLLEKFGNLKDSG